MLQCYNRGCGQKFDPENNTDESCLHHPGEPYFHDAYKGWTCCKKKSVDFTEFLNMKGCTFSQHSNVKPAEPEKPDKTIVFEEPPQEIRKPIKSVLDRPSFDSPLIKIPPTVVPALKDAIDALVPKEYKNNEATSKLNEIPIGTNCKNGGCSCLYTSPEADETECQHHPGFPIFHEGMKYWTCCQKKTSDFTIFMNQKGCSYGKHNWFKKDDDQKVVDCRFDWHQTSTNVIVAIYAKLYHYDKSTVQVNPIRLKVCLVFPDQNGAQFNMDLELRGIIKVESTTVKMYGTKLEITMPKAEAGSWTKLDFPRATLGKTEISENSKETDQQDSDTDTDIDLDDIEPITAGARLTNLSKN